MIIQAALWSFVIAGAVAIGNALLAVGAIPAEMFEKSAMERFFERGELLDREMCNQGPQYPEPCDCWPENYCDS
jgi:hypothetical protein